jgi:hypothetical protein
LALIPPNVGPTCRAAYGSSVFPAGVGGRGLVTGATATWQRRFACINHRIAHSALSGGDCNGQGHRHRGDLASAGSSPKSGRTRCRPTTRQFQPCRAMAVTTADHDIASVKNAAAEAAKVQVDDPAPRSPRPAPPPRHETEQPGRRTGLGGLA